MLKRLPVFAFLAIFAGFLLYQSCKPKVADEAAVTDSNSANDPFPDFGFMVNPSQLKPGQKVFKLSQSYPTTLPTPALPDFYSIDYKKDWRKFLLSVRNYCFEGNTAVDFRVEENTKRGWYHMPWQHYPNNGREGFHGLTKEAPVKPYQLAKKQSFGQSGAWAVGFFNDIAGYTIGQVWADHNNPDVTKMKGGFKHGAVLFKLLFLSMPKDTVERQVPFLCNGIWWDAYANYNFNSLDRQAVKVVLIQMDIMVRDTTAPNGWVFGNFQYNGAMNNQNPWENLVPVGLMFGQDPSNNTNFSNPTPTRTVINSLLKETIINPDSTELPPTHLGWNSRLNGPVDNPQSSCYSCHSTAEYPAGSPISPLFNSDTLAADPVGSPGWMRWFQNLKCGQPFDGPKYASTDFCLQMAEAIQNFESWKDNRGGIFYESYIPSGVNATNNEMVRTKKHGMVHGLGRRNK